MNRLLFSFRPNPENPEHRRAWEILKSVPEGQKNSYLVRAILHEDLTSRLEEMLRRIVREELKKLRLEEMFQKTVREELKGSRLEELSVAEDGVVQEPEIPAQMLDFLSRME